MPDFAEYFNDAESNRREIVPCLAEYWRTPNKENARALLTALRLPVPYAALAAASTAATAVAASQRSEPRAADDIIALESDTSSSGGVWSRRRRNQTAAASSAVFFAAHRLIDLLHDLLDIPPTRTVLERLYGSAAAPLPTALTDELTRLVGDVWATKTAIPRVNRRLVEVAEKLAGLAPPHHHALAFNPDHTLAATQLDIYLQVAVARWYAKPSLEIVLDGVFRDVDLPRADSIGVKDTTKINTTVNETEIARSLTLCAYLQLVLTDWPPNAAVHTKNIRFLVGDFQTMDIAGADHFIASWIRHIQTETAYLSHLPPSAIGTRPIALADLPSLADTPFANVTPNSSGLRVKLPDRPNATGAMLHAIRKGTFVPYGRKKAAAAAASRRAAAMPLRTDAYRSEFFTANKKEWLQAVFRDYGYDLSPTVDTEVFIETLAIVNAFRDALRAEVALARDAVYITPDALALVYYQARADANRVPTNGLRIHPAGPEDLTIRYYAPLNSLHSSISRR